MPWEDDFEMWEGKGREGSGSGQRQKLSYDVVSRKASAPQVALGVDWPFRAASSWHGGRALRGPLNNVALFKAVPDEN